MRIVKILYILGLVLSVLCLPYLMEGGHLLTLFQPIAVFSLIALSYVLCASQLGFRATLVACGTVLSPKKPSSSESTTQAHQILFFSVFAATHIANTGKWLILLQHLSEGLQTHGHYFTSISIGYIYGLLLMALIPKTESEAVSRVLGIGLTFLVAAMTCGIVYAKFA